MLQHIRAVHPLNVMVNVCVCFFFQPVRDGGAPRGPDYHRDHLHTAGMGHLVEAALCGQQHYITAHCSHIKTQRYAINVTGANIIRISKGTGRKVALGERNCIHHCFSCVLLRGFDGFSSMFFLTAPNSTPGLQGLPARVLNGQTQTQTYIDSSFKYFPIACRSDCHPTFTYSIYVGAEMVAGLR